MRRFQGPITVERLVDMFINLFIFRLMMMAVNKTISVVMSGGRKLFARKPPEALSPPPPAEPVQRFAPQQPYAPYEPIERATSVPKAGSRLDES